MNWKTFLITGILGLICGQAHAEGDIKLDRVGPADLATLTFSNSLRERIEANRIDGDFSQESLTWSSTVNIDGLNAGVSLWSDYRGTGQLSSVPTADGSLHYSATNGDPLGISVSIEAIPHADINIYGAGKRTVNLSAKVSMRGVPRGGYIAAEFSCIGNGRFQNDNHNTWTASADTNYKQWNEYRVDLIAHDVDFSLCTDTGFKLKISADSWRETGLAADIKIHEIKWSISQIR